MSDKAVTLQSGYLDVVPPHTMVMADKGFNIADLCSERHLTLYIPPEKRGQSQMPSDAVNKTKRIANLRILVEQVIAQLKYFRIIKNELPVTLIPQIDNILIVCSALVNLREPIYKS